MKYLGQVSQSEEDKELGRHVPKKPSIKTEPAGVWCSKAATRAAHALALGYEPERPILM